jgi:hypothetical protein
MKANQTNASACGIRSHPMLLVARLRLEFYSEKLTMPFRGWRKPPRWRVLSARITQCEDLLRAYGSAWEILAAEGSVDSIPGKQPATPRDRHGLHVVQVRSS